VDPAGRVTTLVRGGVLKAPTGIAVAPGGTLHVADPGAGRVFRLASGVSSAPPSPAAFRLLEEVAPLEPGGVAVAPDGTQIITDLARHVLFAEREGFAYLLAGAVQNEGVRAGRGDDTGDRASFDHPFGIAAASNGAVYVADYANHCIRRIAE
jgi:DNA-binding beta-propeller fold protein YncE